MARLAAVVAVYDVVEAGCARVVADAGRGGAAPMLNGASGS